jgi:hypothetical protein
VFVHVDSIGYIMAYVKLNLLLDFL